MTTAPASDSEAARSQVFHCRQYMDNAREALEKNEQGKTGEMLWGSITQAVRAVDAWRGPVIDDHRSRMMNFARNLSREIDDSNFQNNFLAASSLHDNYYHPALETDDAGFALPGIQRAINQVLALLPEEACNGAGSE